MAQFFFCFITVVELTTEKKQAINKQGNSYQLISTECNIWLCRDDATEFKYQTKIRGLF